MLLKAMTLAILLKKYFKLLIKVYIKIAVDSFLF